MVWLASGLALYLGCLGVWASRGRGGDDPGGGRRNDEAGLSHRLGCPSLHWSFPKS